MRYTFSLILFFAAAWVLPVHALERTAAPSVAQQNGASNVATNAILDALLQQVKNMNDCASNGQIFDPNTNSCRNTALADSIAACRASNQFYDPATDSCASLSADDMMECPAGLLTGTGVIGPLKHMEAFVPNPCHPGVICINGVLQDVIYHGGEMCGEL